MKEYLAIFDLDGTLYDTSDVNYCSYKEAFQMFGIEIDKEYFITKCFGKHYKDFLPEIINGVEQIESVHELKTKVYQRYIDRVRINCHLVRIIQLIKEEYYIAERIPWILFNILITKSILIL